MSYSDTIYIYALCDGHTGETYYVGQTNAPSGRLRAHRCSKRFADIPNLKMILLAQAKCPADACFTESLWIARLRAQGEPLRNKNKRGTRGANTKSKPVWRCKETGELLVSFSHIGRRYGNVTGGTMRHNHKKQGSGDSFSYWDWHFERVSA